MTDVVLDASALLALLLDEPGGDKVKACVAHLRRWSVQVDLIR